MITVRQANRIVRVTENEVAKYVSKGYEIVEDKKADVVQKSVPQTPVEETIKEPADDVTPKKQRRRK